MYESCVSFLWMKIYVSFFVREIIDKNSDLTSLFSSIKWEFMFVYKIDSTRQSLKELDLAKVTATRLDFGDPIVQRHVCEILASLTQRDSFVVFSMIYDC